MTAVSGSPRGRRPDVPAGSGNRARKDFYDWVAKKISFNGITKVERDTAFDNRNMTSAGIRLSYKSEVPPTKRSYWRVNGGDFVYS